jgi:hypothetical protein
MSGKTMDGTVVAVDLKGSAQPIILFTVDPVCAACLRAIPVLDRLLRHAPCAVRAIGVAVNNVEKIRPVLGSRSLPFEMWLEFSGGPAPFVPIAATPASIVFGNAGMIVGVWVGEHDIVVSREMRAALRDACIPQPTG